MVGWLAALALVGQVFGWMLMGHSLPRLPAEVGATLLLDALRRTLAASDQFGIAALLIHCKDEHARDFYTHHVDALVSPIAPLQLIVPTQTIALALGTAHE